MMWIILGIIIILLIVILIKLEYIQEDIKRIQEQEYDDHGGGKG